MHVSGFRKNTICICIQKINDKIFDLFFFHSLLICTKNKSPLILHDILNQANKYFFFSNKVEMKNSVKKLREKTGEIDYGYINTYQGVIEMLYRSEECHENLKNRFEL